MSNFIRTDSMLPTDQLNDQLHGAKVLLKKLSNSASQGISSLLWNLNAHYHVHKSPPLVPILSQMHPVHTLSPYFL